MPMTTEERTFEEAASPEGPEPWAVADGLAYLCTTMVNVYLVGRPGDGPWVLVDAGLPGSADRIARAAARRFGEGSRPEAIVLTHGHFDHVGGLKTLAERWDVPVYAHRLEHPYLTGKSSYPPPDPTVGGGLMASVSWLYPRGPIDLGNRVRPLPEDGSVPGMPRWRRVDTPGHSPGHVSFFRDADRALIAGDAFITTRQESTIAVLTQSEELHGPPMYYTCDWQAAARSARALDDLRPEVAATGHGIPLRGPSMRDALDGLARDFERLAVPRHGRYVDEPARADENGVVSVPPDVPHPVAAGLAGAALGLVVSFALPRPGVGRRS